MDLENYEKIESNVQDVRFGLINIYMHKDNYQDLIMEKTRKSISQEDHEFNCLQAEQRMAIAHSSILKMLGIIRDDEQWITSSYFEYPNEDLLDRREELVNPIESMKFLTHILEALSFLQNNRFLHGDLRPEYIFYDSRRDRYILLDRLGDPTNYTESQRNNLVYENKSIFMSPEMFHQLLQSTEDVTHNPFKSECFSLGMVLLSMFTDELDLSICYNRVEKVFDKLNFQAICDDLKRHFFVGKIEEMISSFLFQFILNLDPKKRCSPRKTLKILSDKVAPLILQELEVRRVKMGWEKVTEFEPIMEESSLEHHKTPPEVSSAQNQLLQEEPGQGQDSVEIETDLMEESGPTNPDKFSKAGIPQSAEISNLCNKIDELIAENKALEESEEHENSEDSGLLQQTFESNVGFDISSKHIKNTLESDLRDSEDSCDLRAKEKIESYFRGTSEITPEPMMPDKRQGSYKTQEFSVSELVSSSSELATENNLNILNDIYHQNEQNLQSYLKQISERREEPRGRPADHQGSVKRLELKFILPENPKSPRTSNQSLHDNQLSLNRDRLNKNLGGRRSEYNRRIDPEPAAISGAE